MKIPLHRQKYCKKFCKHELSNTHFLASTIVNKPMSPNSIQNEINYIFKSIESWIKKPNGNIF